MPSPKVATYDLQPEMNASIVTDKVIASVETGTYDMIMAASTLALVFSLTRSLPFNTRETVAIDTLHFFAIS